MATRKTITKTTTPRRRAARTAHETSKAAAGPTRQELQVAATIDKLPDGFVADGFEITGDVVRVYGRVRAPLPMPHIDAQYVDLGQPAPAPRKDGPLTQAITSLDMRIDEACNALHRLEDEAVTLLLPEPPAAAGEGANGTSPAPVEAPSVARVHYLAGRLERLVNRINNITSRVQA